MREMCEYGEKLLVSCGIKCDARSLIPSPWPYIIWVKEATEIDYVTVLSKNKLWKLMREAGKHLLPFSMANDW